MDLVTHYKASAFENSLQLFDPNPKGIGLGVRDSRKVANPDPAQF
jgi:hypothetical protein